MISENTLCAIGIFCLLVFSISLTDKSCNCAIEEFKTKAITEKMEYELEYRSLTLNLEICQKQGDCWKVYFEQCLKHAKNNNNYCINIVPIDQRVESSNTEDKSKIEKIKLYKECLSNTNQNLLFWCEKILH